MKISVSRNELYTKLKMVTRVVGTSKTTPIIENLYFEVSDDGKLTVKGSDIAGEVIARVDANIENPTSRSWVMDKTLFNALSEMPEQPIELVVDKNVQVRYNNGKFDLPAFDAETFPHLTLPEDSVEIKLDRNQLVEGLKTVLPFTANDELRPVMNGVYMEQVEEKLVFVTTDSHVLACREYQSDREAFNANIPRLAARIILSVLTTTAAETVVVQITSKTIMVDTESYSVRYRLIEGRFPNYKNVIPKAHHTQIVIDRLSFMSVIKRIGIFAGLSTKLIKLDVNSEGIDVSGEDIDYSISAKETIKAEFDGLPILIGFNSNHLLDIIGVVETTDLELYLSEPTRAGIIRPAATPEVTLLIMPMVINN